MSIDAAGGNDPIKQQILANMTFLKCGQKGHYKKDCPNTVGTSPVADQAVNASL